MKYRPILLLATALSTSPDAFCQVLPDTAANRAHGVVGCTQTRTGIECPYSSSSSDRTTTRPTPEELKRARDEKDLSEAALDTNDKGAECYEKGDWDCAVRFFKEALEC